MGDDAGAPGLGRFPPIPRERDRCSTTRNTSRRRRIPPRDRPPRRSAERRGGTARFTIELARAHWLGPRPRPTKLVGTPSGAACCFYDDSCKELTTRGSVTHRAPDLAHSEHANFRFGIRIHSVETARMRRGEPSALPTGVGCRVSGALGSGHASRSNLSPSFAYTEHPYVAAGRASGLVPRSLLPTTKPS
jgi:hypothetical protein